MDMQTPQQTIQGNQKSKKYFLGAIAIGIFAGVIILVLFVVLPMVNNSPDRKSIPADTSSIGDISQGNAIDAEKFPIDPGSAEVSKAEVYYSFPSAIIESIVPTENGTLIKFSLQNEKNVIIPESRVTSATRISRFNAGSNEPVNAAVGDLRVGQSIGLGIMYDLKTKISNVTAIFIGPSAIGN